MCSNVSAELTTERSGENASTKTPALYPTAPVPHAQAVNTEGRPTKALVRLIVRER